MPKQIAQNVAQQVKDIGIETIKEIKKQPGEMANAALEQIGATPQSAQSSQTPSPNLQQIKAQDKVQSEQKAKQLIQDLDSEIKKERQEREVQLKQRREEPEPVQEPEKPLAVPVSKPGQGRIQIAQDKAGAEKGPSRRPSG